LRFAGGSPRFGDSPPSFAGGRLRFAIGPPSFGIGAR